MTNFKIGDRVVFQAGYTIWDGKHGVVCSQYHGVIGVAFDEPLGTHSCAGACEKGHGAWVLPENLFHETVLSSISEENLMEALCDE